LEKEGGKTVANVGNDQDKSKEQVAEGYMLSLLNCGYVRAILMRSCCPMRRKGVDYGAKDAWTGSKKP